MVRVSASSVEMGVDWAVGSTDKTFVARRWQTARLVVLLMASGMLWWPVASAPSPDIDEGGCLGMVPPVAVETEGPLLSYNTPDLTARGWQPGEELFDQVTQALVGMVDQQAYWENRGHVMAGVGPQARRRRLERLARGVLDDHSRADAGTAADHSHISMAARRLGLAVALELDERATSRERAHGDGEGATVPAGSDDVKEDEKAPSEVRKTSLPAAARASEAGTPDESDDEVALNMFVSELPFVSKLPDPSPYDGRPPLEDYSSVLADRQAASDPLIPTSDGQGYRVIDDTDDVVKSPFRGVWGQCKSTRCSHGQWLMSGIRECMQTRWVNRKRTALELHTLGHFSTLKHHFANALAATFPGCGCSPVAPFAFTHIHAYANMAKDPEPDNVRMIRPVCFGVDILEEYAGLSRSCKGNVRARGLNPTAAAPSPTVCMCFNQKAVAASGKSAAAGALPYGAVLHEDVSAHISSAMGLGCTEFITWSGLSTDTQPSVGPEASAVANDGTAMLAERVKTIWKEQKESVRGLTSILGQYASLFKWQVTVGVLPKPGMTIVMLGLNARESIRLIIKFGVKLISFIAKIVMDIVRVMYFTVAALSPSLAKTFKASQQALMEEVGRLRAAVYDRWADHDALKGFDPQELDINTLLNLAGLQPEGSGLVSDAEALAESADCENCNAMLIVSAPIPTPDVWSTLLRVATLDLVGVAIGTQPNPSFTGAFLLKPCTACIASSLRLGTLMKRKQKYWEQYATGCNSVSVGMCYALSTLRHIHFARMYTPRDLDGNILSYRTFCDTLPHTYFDLYRSPTKVPGEDSDIHCGTPAGTPTPGVPFKSMCLASYAFLEKFWHQRRSPFRLGAGDPYDEYESCLEVLQCERTGADVAPRNRERLVRSELVESVKDRILDALWNLDVSGPGKNAFMSTMSDVVDGFEKSYEDTMRGAGVVPSGHIPSGTWSQGPGAVFSRSEWARAECLNVRVDSARDQMVHNTLLRRMVRRQSQREETIKIINSLELSRAEVGRGMCEDSDADSSLPARNADRPIFDDVYCAIERAKEASMKRWFGKGDVGGLLMERFRRSSLVSNGDIPGE